MVVKATHLSDIKQQGYSLPNNARKQHLIVIKIGE